MTATVAQIWRHPIKAIGREALPETDLSAGAWMPFDRLWAVTHARSKPVDGWCHKANFLRGVTDPALMAVTCKLDPTDRRITLQHPRTGQIAFHPDDPEDAARFLDWLAPLWGADLPRPTAVIRQDGVQMTDVPEPWISINNLASLRALGDRAGPNLSEHRWRGNIWIDGLDPWEEFTWIGKTLTLGSARVRVETAITRCKATMANPETGKRDIDTLAALRSLGHQEFGVYARVIDAGRLSLGDPVVLEETAA